MSKLMGTKRFILFLLVLLSLLLNGCSKNPSGEPINIGLIAPLTGPLASSGEAIKRGMLLAMDSVNENGGVLGRPVALVVKDVQNNQEEGVAALKDLVENKKISAVFGGIFSPVMMAQLGTLEELEIPLIDPWGSMSGITENGLHPNFAFRVSVSDKYADEFLVRYALEVLHTRRPGILADSSGWGDTNLEGLLFWLSKANLAPAGIVRFDQGQTDMLDGLKKLQNSGADSLLMVANAPEGASIVRSRAVLNWDIPVISHWGISGGDFAYLSGADNLGNIYTLQTYSFLGESSPLKQKFLESYNHRFGTHDPGDIESPVGVVHGYDGVQLLMLAIEQSGSLEGSKIRSALENLGEYRGIVKTYHNPFTPDSHDALVADDYIMTVWSNGRMIPAPQPGLSQKEESR